MRTTRQYVDKRVGPSRLGAILVATFVGLLHADLKIASGEIIHTLLEPPHVIPSAPGTLDINLDNDGSADFVLILDVTSNLTVERLGNGIGIVEQFVSGSFIARQYLQCETIAGTASFDPGPLNMNGAWIGADNVYLGLRFSIDGHDHLGWARLYVRAFNNSPMLKGYAYNSIPEDEPGGATISPGQTGPPPIICPADINVSCDESTDPTNTGIATATTTCGAPPVVSFTDIVTDGPCPHSYVITRQWTATDVFAQTSTCDQTITVADTTEPIVTAPDDLTLQCAADVPVAATDLAEFLQLTGADASDDCSAQANITITWMGDTSDGNTCPEIITRTYRAEDECGNTTDSTQTITVDDTTNPIVTAPDDLTVQCSADVPAPATDLAEFLQLAGADVSDNCSEQADIAIVWMGDTSDGNTCPEIITRTYRAEDECGNMADSTQTITVDDTVEPIVTAPADLAVQCSADVPAPATNLAEFLQLAGADVSDNCSEQANITITWVGDTSDGNTCPEIITRAYRAEDECGNTADSTQTITVDDTVGPIVTAPADLAVQCLADVPASAADLAGFLQLAGADVSDNCSTQADIAVTWIGDTSDGNTCPEIITRTYRAEDECGNTTDSTQTITVDDTVEPIVTAPADLIVQCSADMPAPAADLAEFLQRAGADVSDNCSEQANITITWMGDMHDEDSRPRIITRTYRAEDECGNTTDSTQTITVMDVTPPVVLSCPKSRTLFADEQCQATVPALTDEVIATDDFDTDLTITQQPPADTGIHLGTTDVVITVADDCGNETVCVLTLTVVDDSPPTIISCPFPQTLMADVSGAVELPDLTGGVNAVDSCDPDLTITQEPPAGTILGVGETAVTVTATDDAGLNVSCRLIITVQPYTNGNDVPEPEPNPTPDDPQFNLGGYCLLRAIRQSLFGIPMCGIGFVACTPIMFVGLLGMKLRLRHRRRPRL